MSTTDKSKKNTSVIKEFQDFVDVTSNFLKSTFPLVYNYIAVIRDKVKKKKVSTKP